MHTRTTCEECLADHEHIVSIARESVNILMNSVSVPLNSAIRSGLR